MRTVVKDCKYIPQFTVYIHIIADRYLIDSTSLMDKFTTAYSAVNNIQSCWIVLLV